VSITLYQYDLSPFCDKARRILRFKKQAFVTEEVTLLASLGPLRRKNPAGKVPFLVCDGEMVADSTDIAHWAERRWPAPSLLPTDPWARAVCHVLEDWADESLYWYEVYLRFRLPHNARRWVPELTKHDVRPMRAMAPLVVPQVLARTLAAQGLGRKTQAGVLADLERHLEALEGLLTRGPFLVGEQLTLADVAVFAQSFCIQGSDEGARALERRPTVTAWMDRVDQATR